MVAIYILRDANHWIQNLKTLFCSPPPLPSKMNSTLQNEPPPSNINHPIPRQKNVNRRGPQIIIWVWLRTLCKVLHDMQVVIIREIIVPVIKYLHTMSFQYFLICLVWRHWNQPCKLSVKVVKCKMSLKSMQLYVIPFLGITPSICAKFYKSSVVKPAGIWRNLPAALDCCVLMGTNMGDVSNA